MKIISAVLCKYSERSENGSYVLHGAGFSEVSFKRFPAIYEITVFFSVWRELSEPEKHQIFLGIEHDSYSFSGNNAEFVFGNNEQVSIGTNTLYKMQIKETGLHFIHIVIDNSRACSLPLIVKLII